MLSSRSVLIGQRDLDRICAALRRIGSADAQPLFDELDAATVVPDELVPADVVTMNSRVEFLDLDSGQTSVVSLVYPHEIDGGPDRVSILAPVGSALIGLREGESIEWPLPKGRRRIRVVSVSAP